MIDGSSSILGRLEPVGLAELDAVAALQDRLDRKYLLPSSLLDPFVSQLVETHRVLELAHGRSSRYSSIYFDTPDLVSHRAHRQGRRRRWKARTRRYLDSGLTRLELKVKGFRRRTRKSTLEVPATCHGALDARARSFLARELGRSYGVSVPVDELQPALLVDFRRATLADVTGIERVTIDFGLELARPDGTVLARSLPDALLVETKSGRRWGRADLALRSLGVRRDRYSKYCSGMMLAHPELPFPELRPVMRRWLDVADVAGSAGPPSRQPDRPGSSLVVEDAPADDALADRRQAS